MTTGNRKTSNNRNRNKSNSNSRKRQTKKERMAEIEKTEVFRTEVILWIIVAVSLLLFISNMGFVTDTLRYTGFTSTPQILTVFSR